MSYDAPRGMEFLYSPNRFDVATCRARDIRRPVINEQCDARVDSAACARPVQPPMTFEEPYEFAQMADLVFAARLAGERSRVIAKGPPGAVGVKQLQYVSGDGIGDGADYLSLGLHRLAKPAGAIAVGAWGYGWIVGNEAFKCRALGLAIGAFLVQIFARSR